jgi:hypothetical protein
LFGAAAHAACYGAPAAEIANPARAGLVVLRELRPATATRPSSAFLPAEIFGSGVALLDFDGDGDLDVYLRDPAKNVSGGVGESAGGAVGTAGDRLFRNRWKEDGTLDFEDVSASAGVGGNGTAFGIAVGDVDNDGDPDVFLTNLGPDVLLENRDGVFARRPGPWNDDSWSAPASFFDADRDGLLDLFVGRYVAFSADGHRPCPGPDTRPDYCGPLSYDPLPDAIYHNLGAGRFEAVVAPLGIGSLRGNALGSITEDFDEDGWLDVFVANDGGDNHLWLNRSGLRFEEQAVIRGLAVNAVGQREAGMGVDMADFDRDGDADLIITHLTGESHTLYVNLGDGTFDDQTRERGIELPSRPRTGFGVGWIHADDDAWLDLLVVNGRIHAISEQRAEGRLWPYGETPQLMLGTERGTFHEGSAGAGDFLERTMVGRAAAFGDLDDDGDLDLVVTDNDGAVLVVENRSRSALPWIGIVPRTGTPPRDALGAGVAAVLDDGSVLTARARTDGSYLSARDPRVLFRLPPGRSLSSLEIRWPSGCAETLPAPAPGSYHVIHQECATDA